jgi:sugar lactone lactonase YvrE
MAYIKITNGTQEPYSIGKLRRDNKTTTSFPKVVEPETLAEYGVYTAIVAESPVYDEATQVMSRNDVATNIGGQWTYEHTVRDKTTEELAALDENTAAAVRSKRTGLLAATDWTQIADAPTDAAAWAMYRQALRDVTDHVNFPYLEENNWPVKPTAT